MPDLNQILIQTKLHRPHLMKDLITRTRLIEQLNRDIDRPLILVCAAAGFGKSSLVTTWLERMATGEGEIKKKLPSAWLSLDAADSDLNLFVRYFISALRTIFKEACQDTLALLRSQQSPPVRVIYATLINELEALPGEAILVLDDFHTIKGDEVRLLLGELVNHWPQPLHLVLISRLSPILQLNNLRARGMLSEIRTRDLRFTPEETTAYLGRVLPDREIKDIQPILDKRFEGWPAGLHLAILSLRPTGSQESIISALSFDNPNITAYLVDEVLSLQYPVIYSFLLKTSILDSFCASLCEAVIGETDPAWSARTCLDWIDRSELFLIPLDDQQEWYRYHHLFQEILQRRLSNEITREKLKDLHLRASTWFEELGLIDKALQHALVAGDLDRAAYLMKAGLCQVINLEDRPTLERWLHMLPEDVIQRNPWLLMIKAWTFQFSWRLDLQLQVVEQVEILLDSETCASLPANDRQILRGQILLIKGQFSYLNNQTRQAIDLCRESLTLMPPSWTFIRGSTMLYLCFSLQANGEQGEAETLLQSEYTLCADKTDLYSLILLQTLGFIYLWSGQLETCKQVAQVLILGATHIGNIFTKSWGDYYLGVACYLRNDLETAAQHFTQILRNRHLIHAIVYRDAVAGMALIYQIRGESAEAWQLMEAISRSDIEEAGAVDNRTCSLRAKLQLLQGDLEGACRWVDTFIGPPPDQPLLFFEEPQITRVRVLLASSINADLQSALQALDDLEDIAERTHNTRCKIELLALRALALETQGKTAEASVVLKQALKLAHPGGFIRVFADLGEPMHKMLRHLVQQGYSVAAIQPILAAFPHDVASQVTSESHASPARNRSFTFSALAHPLTPREFDVLILLQEPFSFKEIAAKLHISYQTAKRHTNNLYGKLGVNRRWDAVARAKDLGILPPG